MRNLLLFYILLFIISCKQDIKVIPGDEGVSQTETPEDSEYQYRKEEFLIAPHRAGFIKTGIPSTNLFNFYKKEQVNETPLKMGRNTVTAYIIDDPIPIFSRVLNFGS